MTLALAEETETAYMSKNYDPCLGNGEGLLICSVLRVIVIANNKGAAGEKGICCNDNNNPITIGFWLTFWERKEQKRK